MTKLEPAPEWDVAIIGAGVAGLVAREYLLSRGRRVVTIEKSRGLGGRLATRRFGARTADLGAQYASARSPEFRARLEAGAAAGVTAIHLAGDSVHPRWIHRDGMSRLARLWTADAPASGDAPIELGTRVGALGVGAGALGRDAGWRLRAGEREWRSRAVLLTAPLPQSLELLNASGFEATELGGFAFLPCIALVAASSRDTELASPGVLKRPNARLEGIFDQRRKGVAAEAASVVVHASASWSRELWELTDEEITRKIVEEARPWLPEAPAETFIHRWRYCEPEKLFPAPFAEPSRTPGLWLAGDGFGRASIEGAWTSGRRVAEAIDERLN